uniref:Putative ATP-dependent helicase n=1 Tax=uncultured bacterium fosmid pJB65E1 TaxID=1478066 RepID=A0A0H3U7M8_9BACT|nr:putative ATP-dependent helicase [uncultured bacterium fosmid pJB65E1]
MKRQPPLPTEFAISHVVCQNRNSHNQYRNKNESSAQDTKRILRIFVVRKNKTTKMDISRYSRWDLPVLEVAEEVNRCLAGRGAVVVTAPPGAGKSTLLPITILEGLDDGTIAAGGKTGGEVLPPAITSSGGAGCGGRVLMLEPRRIAARQIAERISGMLGETVGETVGYRMRFETRISSRTRIEIITEGILARMLTEDPSLEGVSVVIFDEFHERSLDSDLALALVMAARQIFRPDLKIAVMSATIRTEEICRYLGCPAVESAGRMFPVEIRYSPVGTAPEEIAPFVRDVHGRKTGDILVFLPGEREIQRCAQLLEGKLGDTRICPLYGMLSFEQQRAAVSPSAPGERKVVLATPIAETSVTIEGVRIVIDSGLCRKNVFNPVTSLSRLETVTVSIDMAGQRSGRAGRTASGICYRLWDAAQQSRMKETRTPEIEEADLAPVMLTAALWGESDLRNLDWLTPPPSAAVHRAAALLKNLGALDDGLHLTSRGRKMGTFPCHPRIAGMLLQADTPARKGIAADIAAILEEKDPMPEGGCDICERISALRKSKGGRWEHLGRISSQYRRLMGVSSGDDAPVDPYEVGMLLAAAYPERVAMQFNDGRGQYLLANGDTAILDRNDALASCRWIAAASVNSRAGGDGRIFLAAPVDPSSLGFLAVTRENITWNSKKGEVTAALETRIGRLVISSRPLCGDVSSRITAVICEAARREGTSMFDFNEACGDLQRRVAAVAAWHPELELPDLSTEAVLSAAGEWVPLYIGKATTTSQMKK